MANFRAGKRDRRGSSHDKRVRKLYLLWAQANAFAGYRYSVEGKPGSQVLQGKVASISVVWTNYGSAAAIEHWVPGYKLVDFTGAVVRSWPATVNLKNLVHDDSSPSRDEAPPVTADGNAPRPGFNRRTIPPRLGKSLGAPGLAFSKLVGACGRPVSM